MGDSAPPSPPIRPAATVCVLREAPGGFEVLMVRRNPQAVFVGDGIVFPGGAVEDFDRSSEAVRATAWDGDPDEQGWRAAALRELAEEAGLFLTSPAGAATEARGPAMYRSLLAAGTRLDGNRLAYVSNWVTPRGQPRRFDTRFYVVEVAAGTTAVPDGEEVLEGWWVTPRLAMERAARGEWLVILPTLKHLELLSGFASAAQAVDHARSLDRVDRVEPRMVFHADGGFTVLLPGQPGYEAAPR